MLKLLKKNWLSIILFSVVVFLLLRPAQTFQRLNTFESASSLKMAPMAGGGRVAYDTDYAPTDSSNRLVITDTSLSLQVKDVASSIQTIQSTAESLGGFLVNSNINQPQMSASGTITVRVPTDQRDSALQQFKNLAIKVVSQNVSGRDVTDQYEDLDARLATLNKTKSKFESILDSATRVTDILEVTRELSNIQSQIDSVIGQKDYLSKSASLSKITIYLSTDELALPYTPDQAWRPAVIFKTAVRSLVSTFRSVGSFIIWAAVYLPIILPILLVIWWLKRKGKI